MTNSYDIAIIGSGPIGASTAYFLSKNSDKKVIVITADPTEERISTYKFAGGSVQFGHWKEEAKLEMTSMTANFLKDLSSKGEDLSLIEDEYLFLDEGIMAPAINVAGAKVVNYFVQQAKKNGVEVKENTTAQKLQQEGDKYKITTDKGAFMADKVLVAVGPSVKKLVPDAPVELEKRVLFILDLPVSEERKKLPHTIIPINNGWVYFFIKKVGDEFKVIVGQEELIEHNDKWEEENYFDELLKMGLAERAPFLKDAKVEKVLWGFDSLKKVLEINTKNNKLFSVNCGSAVRSCVYIGQKITEKLLEK